MQKTRKKVEGSYILLLTFAFLLLFKECDELTVFFVTIIKTSKK
jgi:hypothetical protein